MLPSSHEREWLLDFGNGNGKWQIPFPFFGNGNPSGKFQSNFREREWKFHKIPFPFSGTGMRVKNSIPIFGNGNESEKFHSRLSGRELEDGIPGNSREFPGIPGNSRDREFPGYCYCKFATSRLGIGILQIFGLVTHCLGKGGCLKWCQNTGIAKSSFPPSQYFGTILYIHPSLTM